MEKIEEAKKYILTKDSCVFLVNSNSDCIYNLFFSLSSSEEFKKKQFNIWNLIEKEDKSRFQKHLEKIMVSIYQKGNYEKKFSNTIVGIYNSLDYCLRNGRAMPIDSLAKKGKLIIALNPFEEDILGKFENLKEYFKRESLVTRQQISINILKNTINSLKHFDFSS